MDKQQIARSTLTVVRAIDLADLPVDGDVSMDVSVRQTILWQGTEIERLQARIAEAIVLLKHQVTVVDSGKVQALVVLKAAEAASVSSQANTIQEEKAE